MSRELGRSRTFATTVADELRPGLRQALDAGPRFVPLGPLGEGGLGEVSAALDQDIGRKVAIKRIRSDRLSEHTLLRFRREIRTVGGLEHSNIVPIHDVGRDADGALYFVMRHVDGETLESIIDRLRRGDRDAHRRFGFERRVQIMAAVLEALSYAHAHGVVHRDVKPANVMVGRYGEVLLLDWGVAVRLDEDGQDLGAVIGTPAYMAPEQARGDVVDARTDLYAACVTLHELLTLHHYLEDCVGAEELLAEVQTRPVPFAARVRSPHQDPVPMDLAWLVHQGVQKDPARRYPSADALLARLARRAEGDIPVQCHVTFTKRATTAAMRFVDRHVMAMAAAMGLLAVVLVAGALGGVAALFALATPGE